MAPLPFKVHSPSFESTLRFSGFLSAIIPGLGQLYKNEWQGALKTIATGCFLAGITWTMGTHLGTAPAGFFALLLILPWWCIQAYEASFSVDPGFFGTCKIILLRGHDIRYLGALFLITAFTDLYIILANPEYGLTVFCTKPTGFPGFLAKAQSPTLHVAIGYGFLRLSRWALFVYFLYAAFGLLNATVNFACLGYGRIRTVFLITLALFTWYVFIRRECFGRRSPVFP